MIRAGIAKTHIMEPKQEFKQSTTVATGRPLQRIPWAEKVKDEKQWFKNNVEYYISLSNFNFDGTGPTRKDLRLLYQVYNSQFPSRWFSHVTDPLSAEKPQHRKFPAKVRPVTILRTNLDLLMGEYPKRPFVYQVTNLGEDGYNRFTDALAQAVKQNLTQHFAAEAQAQMQQQGVPVNKIPGLDEIELPDALKERFSSSYRDAIAIRGQRWLKRGMKEYKIREKFLRMFKDWLIAGRTCSYKGIEHGAFVYERISPLNLDYDKSPDLEYIEDGEWAVCRRLLTLSDVVDKFYEQLKDEQLHDLENRSQYKSPIAFFQYLQETYDRDTFTGKIPVYHVVWKGKKHMGFLSFPDPITGKMQETTVDEDYVINKDLGEKIDWKWVNVTYEGWRVGDNIYLTLGEIPVQRNEMNNVSACKLPYNGRNYSDLHTENISVLEMGLPFQIMYIIINYVLERTIAKSKGKVLLVDKNAIPRGDGWNDEKFFYYAEALGYALMNRNQPGVDKTWNQYQVLDMSLFDQIRQLIELQDHFKQQWDDIIGINRPRKGETYASDGKAVSEMGLMQSSVITDMIFNYFEEFTERELQGILDFSKFVNIDGVKSIYSNEDFDTELLNIDPNTYAYAELGILVNRSSDELATLNQMKGAQNIQAMIQAGVKMSTIMEVYQSQNVAELKMKLRKIEDIEAAMEQQTQQSEQEAQQAADERKKDFAGFENNLEATLIDKEWDRRDQNAMIVGEFNELAHTGQDDAQEVEKNAIERYRIMTEAQTEREKITTIDRKSRRDAASKDKEIASREKVAEQKHATELKKAKITAAKKPTTKQK